MIYEMNSQVKNMSRYNYATDDMNDCITLYDEEEENDWSFAKWLPHSWNEDNNIRFIGTNIKDIKEISANIEKVISERKLLNDNEKEELTPHYIVFSMSKSLGIKAEFIKSILNYKNNRD